jgi:hypothetical protein
MYRILSGWLKLLGFLFLLVPGILGTILYVDMALDPYYGRDLDADAETLVQNLEAATDALGRGEQPLSLQNALKRLRTRRLMESVESRAYAKLYMWLTLLAGWIGGAFIGGIFVTCGMVIGYVHGKKEA